MSLLERSLTGGGLAVAVILLRALAINHLPKRSFLALWGVVLARLLLPYRVPLPVPVPLLQSKLPTAVISAPLPQAPVTVQTVPNIPAAVPAAEAAAGPDLLPLLWAAGALALALFFLVSYNKWRWIFRTSLPVENPFAKTWLAEHPLRRTVSVRQSDRIAAPLTYGLLRPVILDEPASRLGIAVVHSVFNVLCTLLMLPLSSFLEKLVTILVPDDKRSDAVAELDERLFATPSIALERCHTVAAEMAETAVAALKDAMVSLRSYTPALAASIREKEDKTDHYEDILGTYLVNLSTRQISEADSREAAKLLKMIGDFERIADHAVNILESAEELRDKELRFTEDASSDLTVVSAAVRDILDLSLNAFLHDDLNAASMVEPLEQVIDQLKEQLRTRHILRMQKGDCSIDAGFAWSDLLTSLERTADHCSNIAGCVIDIAHGNMDIHQSLRAFRTGSEDFRQRFQEYQRKYVLNGYFVQKRQEK